jgi:hypothetical protein
MENNIHMIGWGVALCIVVVFVVSIARNGWKFKK